jgi:hypothetical protein
MRMTRRAAAEFCFRFLWLRKARPRRAHTVRRMKLSVRLTHHPCDGVRMPAEARSMLGRRAAAQSGPDHRSQGGGFAAGLFRPDVAPSRVENRHVSHRPCASIPNGPQEQERQEAGLRLPPSTLTVGNVPRGGRDKAARERPPRRTRSRSRRPTECDAVSASDQPLQQATFDKWNCRLPRRPGLAPHRGLS